MNKRYLFISDQHLGLQTKEIENKKERLLVKFLKFAEDNCDELFILGDLFDYWFEYKRVYQKGFFRTFTALQDVTERGIRIHYFIGNHDFLHRDFFTKEIGIKMYNDPIEVMLNGKKFYIGHGDGLVQNDIGYRILKVILRNKFIQRLYSLLHPDIGVAIASKTSKSSRAYTKQKDYGEIDGMLNAAKQKIDEGFDYVMFGHTHERSFVEYRGGRFINLGSWIEAPCYGKFDSGEFEIIDWQ
ncbi:MAG: UDP-2,3-diacylglucosamine diphosphatase [Ignavibacteria bacterium]|nr:UDP-2,3-diacylglucosamine diphosphatase [Ignavibacteria bacterium]